MNTILLPVNVKFLFNETGKDLFAYFPSSRECFSHGDGLSICTIDYVVESRKASKKERAALRSELISLGYDLNELN